MKNKQVSKCLVCEVKKPVHVLWLQAMSKISCHSISHLFVTRKHPVTIRHRNSFLQFHFSLFLCIKWENEHMWVSLKCEEFVFVCCAKLLKMLNMKLVFEAFLAKNFSSFNNLTLSGLVYRRQGSYLVKSILWLRNFQQKSINSISLHMVNLELFLGQHKTTFISLFFQTCLNSCCL